MVMRRAAAHGGARGAAIPCAVGARIIGRFRFDDPAGSSHGARNLAWNTPDVTGESSVIERRRLEFDAPDFGRTAQSRAAPEEFPCYL